MPDTITVNSPQLFITQATGDQLDDPLFQPFLSGPKTPWLLEWAVVDNEWKCLDIVPVSLS